MGGLGIGTGKASGANALLEALARGRTDHQFFAHYFLGETLRDGLHDGQLLFSQRAQATINILATSNRWGKTTELPEMHYHSCTYKIGAESRYMDEAGKIDHDRWLKLKYQTIHTADEWQTAAIVHEEALKLKNENARLDALIAAAPLSEPPYIDFINGAKWKFRTLGHDARGIDGHSYYLITVDEAGWISDLESKMDNVLRIRVADVRGRIVIVGTFKPGVSRDFYRYAVKASSYTGQSIDFAHSSDEADEREEGQLDAGIQALLDQAGIDLSEYIDAATREAELNG